MISWIACGTCRGEKQQLPLLRHRLEDLLDVVAKPHVEHLVGLVEHDELERVEAQRSRAPPCGPSRGRACRSRPARPRRARETAARSFVRRKSARPVTPCLKSESFAGLLRHLHREFARGAKDQHLQRWRANCGSTFSIAGIAKAAVLPDPVADCPTTSRPGENRGNHRGLDRRGFLKAHLIDGLEQFRREAEFGEATFFHARTYASSQEKKSLNC